MKLQIAWIVGFVDGEGCFHVALNKHSAMKCGVQCLPEFTVTQHQRDLPVLHALKTAFACGVVRKSQGEVYCYRVRSHAHFMERIIPFFEKHKLKSKKSVDFLKFRRVIHLMSRGGHLTPAGIDEIRAISNTMKTKGACKAMKDGETIDYLR